MKEIFIHIGYPKAASTYLQEKIFRRFDHRCLAYNPPEISRELFPGFLGRTYANKGYSDEEVQTFKQAVWNKINELPQDKLFLSNEGLCGLGFQPWRRTIALRDMLHTVFPHAKIIIVFRDPVEWLVSSYNLATEYGFLVSFNRFINFKNGDFVHGAKDDDWTYDALDLHYSRLYDLYKEKFEIVHPIDFNAIRCRPETVVRQLEAFINCKTDIQTLSRKKVNKSLEERQLKMIGILADFLHFESIWNEKYTFLPNYFKASFRTSDTLCKKIRYLFVNAVRFLCFYSGRFLGKILFRKNTSLYNSQQLQLLRNVYRNEQAALFPQPEAREVVSQNAE